MTPDPADGTLVTDQYGSPESPAGDTTEPDGTTQTGTDFPASWTLTCYGRPVAEYVTLLPEATAAANEHIRHCPAGPMPWANSITWHRVTLPELGGRYVSAAGGSWLNHHLTPHPAPVTTPPTGGHAWTSHGHPCCRQPGPPVGDRPRSPARCGGPAICGKCAQEADQTHATTPREAHP